MNKTRLEILIERQENWLVKIPTLRLGFLLKECYWSKMFDRGYTIQRGVFQFNINSHDTGVSVAVDIINGEDTLRIRSQTYWYDESQYGHNSVFVLEGAWDSAFSDVVEGLRQELTAIKVKEVKSLEKSLEEEIKNNSSMIDSFSKMFN
jgi:hypothetical protein